MNPVSKKKAEIDITDLQEEVMAAWDDRGEPYTESHQIDVGRWEETIKPDYLDILSNPLFCIQELGFDSFSAYMSSKNKEA